MITLTPADDGSNVADGPISVAPFPVQIPSLPIWWRDPSPSMPLVVRRAPRGILTAAAFQRPQANVLSRPAAIYQAPAAGTARSTALGPTSEPGLLACGECGSDHPRRHLHG